MKYRYDLPDEIERPRAERLRNALFAIREIVGTGDFSDASDHLYEMVGRIADEAESALTSAGVYAPPED